MRDGLALFKDGGISSYGGMTVALCNDPRASLKAAEIERLRADTVREDTFKGFVFLFMERFDKEPGEALLKYYFQRVRAAMSESEFRAAAHDAMASKLYFADLLPYLLEHVEKQRDNGPDLFALSVAEMMSDDNA